MLKIFVATLIGLGVAGGTVAMAEAPAEKTGTPSSTHNIRLAREEPLPIPADAKVPQWWALAREVGWTEDAMATLDYVILERAVGSIVPSTVKTPMVEAVACFN
jgi:hypothetical protein